MRQFHSLILGFVLLFLPLAVAIADSYQKTIDIFRGAGESATFFDNSVGYAVFPTVGKGGYFIGGAYGEGRVYKGGRYVGDTRMTQLTLGLQLGGQAFSQIVFFQDERAFKDFTSGSYEFGAQASVVAITAGAQVAAGSAGNSAGVSGGQRDAKTVGGFYKGMAVFTIAKGGLMYEATVGGQKFDYRPL